MGTNVQQLDLEGDYSGYGTEYDGAMDASFYSTAPVFVRQPVRPSIPIMQNLFVANRHAAKLSSLHARGVYPPP